MEAKIVWLGIFAILYAIFCIYRSARSAPSAATASEHFIAGRELGSFVFIFAATAASFSGWTFLGHPGLIYTDGFPYAFTSLYAITIPLAGLLFFRRQWLLGKRFGYVTPGEMLSDYFGGRVVQLLTLAVALCVAIPFLGLQLFASGFLLNALSDGLIPIGLGAVVMAGLLLVYVSLGGLRGVAHVAVLQAVLLILGLIIIGVLALAEIGGWARLLEGIAALAGTDTIRTPQGFSHYLAVPDVVQLVASGPQAIGGPWTAAMIFAYTGALIGIQCSPTFSMWAMASKDPRPFAAQQVWMSAFLIGLILIVFSAVQGFAGHFLGADADFAQRFPQLTRNLLGPMLQGQGAAGDLMQAPGRQLALVPLLIELIVATAPWLVGFLAICGLSAMHSTAASYMSTTGSMIARDLVLRHLRPGASEPTQILFGRLGSALVLLAALALATRPMATLIAAGSFALAASVQMLPALIALCYAPRLTGPGIVAGVLAGLAAALVTETSGAAVGITAWGRWPVTIHSAFWGLAVNVVAAVAVSAVTQSRSGLTRRLGFHDLLRAHTGLPATRRKLAPLAWIIAVVWVFFAIGPGVVIGNTAFGNPNDPASWPLGLPSIWIWQILWWALGVFMMWFLAYRMELSALPSPPLEPASAERPGMDAPRV